MLGLNIPPLPVQLSPQVESLPAPFATDTADIASLAGLFFQPSQQDASQQTSSVDNNNYPEGTPPTLREMVQMVQMAHQHAWAETFGSSISVPLHPPTPQNYNVRKQVDEFIANLTAAAKAGPHPYFEGPPADQGLGTFISPGPVRIPTPPPEKHNAPLGPPLDDLGSDFHASTGYNDYVASLNPPQSVNQWNTSVLPAPAPASDHQIPADQAVFNPFEYEQGPASRNGSVHC